MPKLPFVYVTRNIPKPGLDLLRKECEVKVWDSDDAIPRDELLKHIPGVDGLLCMLTDRIDKEVLDAAGEKYLYLHIVNICRHTC